MAGYSGKPLAEKLGIKPGHRVALVNAPIGIGGGLGPALKQVELVNPPRSPMNLVMVFVLSKTEFKRAIVKYRKLLAPDGMLWISWPKKTSGMKSDVTEDAVREAALANQLVDVKVCAVDETWSGLKLVIPVALRARSASAR